MIRFFSIIAFVTGLFLASSALADGLVAHCGSCPGDEPAAEEGEEAEEAVGCEHCGTEECACDHGEEAADCEHCGTEECTCDHGEEAAGCERCGTEECTCDHGEEATEETGE